MGAGIVQSAQRIGIGLESWTITFQSQVRTRDFSHLWNIQTGCGVQPTSSPMGAVAHFTGSKVNGMWSKVLMLRMSRVIAVLSPIYLHGGHRDTFAFTSLHNFVHPLLFHISSLQIFSTCPFVALLPDPNTCSLGIMPYWLLFNICVNMNHDYRPPLVQ